MSRVGALALCFCLLLQTRSAAETSGPLDLATCRAAASDECVLAHGIPSALVGASSLAANGRWADALRELDATSAGGLQEPQSLHIAARLYLTAHLYAPHPDQLARANELVNKLASSTMLNADLLATKGFAFERGSRLEDAIKAYGDAIAIEPRHGFARAQRGKLLSFSGKTREAIKDLDVSIDVSPDNLAARAERARLLLAQEKPKDALVDIERLLAVRPYDIIAIMMRVTARSQLGQQSTALEDLDQLLGRAQAGPVYALAGSSRAKLLWRRAVLLVDLKQRDKATSDILEALELGGKSEVLRMQIYLRQNGFPATRLDGKVSEPLTDSIRSCFAGKECRSGLMREA